MSIMFDSDTEFIQPGVFTHSGSTVHDGGVGLDEAIAIAGLDWEVESRPVWTQSKGQMHEVPNARAVVRTDTGEPLSVMSSAYRPVNNREAFEFVEGFGTTDSITFTGGGSLYGGRKVWLEARLDRDLYIGKDIGEGIDPMLYFGSSHDGSMGISLWITPKRIACSNALTFSRREAARSWKARHTRNVLERRTEAALMLDLASRHFDWVEEVGNRLITVKVPDIYPMVSRILPFSVDGQTVINASDVPDSRHKTLVLNKRERIMDHYRDDNAANIIGTAWGFVQSVTAYETHTRYAKNADVRADRQMFGEGYLSTDALNLALALA